MLQSPEDCLALGSGVFEGCDPDGGAPTLVSVPLITLTRISGMQTLKDPDGPGPAVPLDQMGSGEPGTAGAHDLAVLALTASKKVTLSDAKPVAVAKVTVQVQNRGQHTETIGDLATLQSMVELQIESLDTATAGGAPPAIPATIIAPAKFPIVLKPKQKLKVVFSLQVADAIDPLASTKLESHADYRFIASVHHEALAGAEADDHPQDDVAPRLVPAPYVFDSYPDGKIVDRGAGAKLPNGTFGGEVQLDVVVK